MPTEPSTVGSTSGGAAGEAPAAAVSIDDISSVVEELIAALGGDVPGKAEELAHGLASLSEYIHAARSEIADIRPDEVKEDFLPRATDELDAIVEATADATNSIMDAVEMVEDVMGRVEGDDAGKLIDATTKIYEACTFQDITGQRITKVVTMLKHIEDKIDAMLGHVPARNVEKAEKTAETGPKEVTDEDLLNGPGLKEEAQSQEDIDALLASFD